MIPLQGFGAHYSHLGTGSTYVLGGEGRLANAERRVASAQKTRFR